MFAGGLARFGFVTELLSMPVRLGYLMGIAVTVIVAQLPKLFGFSVEAESFLRGVRDFVAGTRRDQRDRARPRRRSLALILGLRRVAPKVPGCLPRGRRRDGGGRRRWASPTRCRWSATSPPACRASAARRARSTDFKTLIPAAVGIAFVAFTDTSVLSRSYAGRLRQEVDQNQELAVLGVANVATGFFQGFPMSTSSSRTAVAEDVGAGSQITGLVGAVVLALLLLVRHRSGARPAAVDARGDRDRRRARV